MFSEFSIFYREKINVLRINTQLHSVLSNLKEEIKLLS